MYEEEDGIASFDVCPKWKFLTGRVFSEGGKKKRKGLVGARGPMEP
jgi:hypothetical protein